MSKALNYSIWAAVLIGIACVVLLSSKADNKNDKIEITIAGTNPPSHFLVTNVYRPWTEEIERRSGGQVSFQWNVAGTLFSMRHNPEAVEEGVAGMSEQAGFLLDQSAWRVTSVFALPFLFESTLQANLTYLDALEEIPELKAEMKGFKILGAHNSDFINFHMARGKRAPATLEEFKGLRIIHIGGVSAQLIALLGANPRDVAVSDRYLTIERGEADGQVQPTVALSAWRYDEISDAHSIVNIGSAPLPGIMNRKLYEQLPDATRQAIDEMVLSWTRFTGCLVDDRRQKMLEGLSKRGDKMVYWHGEERDVLIETIQPIYDDWFNRVAERGIDGQAILQKVKDISTRYKNANHCEPDSWWPADSFTH